MSFAKIEPHYQDFIAALNDMYVKYAEFHGFTILTTFSLEPGKKYVRVVASHSGSRSVYCFLDGEGNIYKASGWAVPAKHIRGSLFDPNYSIGKALGPFGAAYLR